MTFGRDEVKQLARDARDIVVRLGQHAVRLRYEVPFSPYQRMSSADRAAFGPVLRVWKPDDSPAGVMLRWFMSEWCNYACPYCSQTHGRNAAKGHGMTAHAFDNFPLEQWQDAFERHFANVNLAVLITGGEPFVDRKAMPRFLKTVGNEAPSPTARCHTVIASSWRLRS